MSKKQQHRQSQQPYSNVTVQGGELVFGGTVQSTGGVAHAPIALGKMRSLPTTTTTTSSSGSQSHHSASASSRSAAYSSPSGAAGGGGSPSQSYSPSSHNNNNSRRGEPMSLSQAAFSHSSSTLPARATLRVNPSSSSSSATAAASSSSSSYQMQHSSMMMRPGSASGSSYDSQNPTRSPTPFGNNTNNNNSRDDQIDSLLERSRAMAPTPNPTSGIDQSMMMMTGGGRRSATPLGNRSSVLNQSGNNTSAGSPSSSSAASPSSSSSSTRYLGERGPIEASDFDVDTDHVIALGSTIPGGESGGASSPAAGGGGGDVSAEQSRISTAASRPLHVPFAPTIRSRTGVVDIMSPLVLRDYILLAEACQRAGRARVEGTAYFKIAHLLSGDEEQKPKAAVYLRKYLQVCRRINDLQGEAKALNALGIIHYEMALTAATAGSQQSQLLLRIALGFHRQHAEIADAAGIFIANTNAGLCHSRLGDHSAAAEAHKLAASFAVQAGDRDAEALALSNLSDAATKTGDLATSRLCAQRQLDVGNATHNAGVSCEAHEQLAQLAVQRSDFSSATTHLVSALEVALKEGDQRRALRLRCQLGVAQAAAGMESRVSECVSAMESSASPGASTNPKF